MSSALKAAVVISWVAFGVFCADTNAVSWRFVKVALMPAPLWLFGVLVIAPLFAFSGNGIAVVSRGPSC